jgi:hypothetical protein
MIIFVAASTNTPCHFTFDESYGEDPVSSAVTPCACRSGLKQSATTMAGWQGNNPQLIGADMAFFS